MPYLIDGHNLIPKVPGLSLSAIDDELRLVDWLQAFSQAKQKDIEVFFDLAPHGYPPNRKFGRVKAHFVRQGQTADNAIQARLLELKGDAQNYLVVSSDRQVLAAARAARARVVPSEDFARELLNTRMDESSSSLSRTGSPGGSKNAAGSTNTAGGRNAGKSRQTGGGSASPRGEPALSPDEVKEWENLFKRGKDGSQPGSKDSR